LVVVDVRSTQRSANLCRDTSSSRQGRESKTTFTVEQTVEGAHVRFDTVIDEPGVPGILYRLFAARMLGAIYDDELRRLEEHARAHPLPLS
jgi:hypothetical protein